MASLSSIGLIFGSVVSPAWRTSLEALLIPLVAIAFFVLIAGSGLPRQWVAVLIVGAATVVAAIAIARFVDEVVFWFGVIGDVAPSSSFWQRAPVTLPRVGVGALHPNETAMIGAIALPIAIAFRRGASFFRIGWSAAIVALTGLVFVTGSRGGWIAAAVAVVLTLWLLRDKSPESTRRWRIGVMAVLALAVVGGAVFTVGGYRPEFLFRGTVGDRLPVWAAAWEMFLDRPLLGHGTGAFAWLADDYLGTLYPGVEARRIWHEAHNGYLQLLVEVGIIGVVVLGSALWLVVSQARESLSQLDLAVKRSGAAVLGAFFGFGAHSIFEASTAGLVPSIFLAAACGMVFVSDKVGAPESSESRQRVFAAGLIVGPLAFLLLTIGPQMKYEDGVAASWSEDWAVAASAFEEAAQSDPLPLYARMAAVAIAENDSPDSEMLVDVAELEPFDSAAALNAIGALAVGSSPEAQALLDDVEDRLRSEEVVVLMTGVLHNEFGASGAAFDSYTFVVFMNPWMATSPVWDSVLPDSGAHADLLLAASTADPCGTADVFFLQGIDLGPMASAIEQSCPEGSVARMSLALARNEPGASSAVEQAAGTMPDRFELRRLAGVALLQSDTESARRHLAIAVLLGDDWSSLALARSYGDQPSPASVENLLSRGVLGFSPVLNVSGTDGVYRFGAIRTRIVDRRFEAPSTLGGGLWESAATSLHLVASDLRSGES